MFRREILFQLTSWIEARANDLLERNLDGVKRMLFAQALRASTTHKHDFLSLYVSDLGSVVDMNAVRDAKIKLGVDPPGGSGHRLLVADCGGIRSGSDDCERNCRSYISLHECGLGGEDSHRYFLTVCDAEAFDRTAASFVNPDYVAIVIHNYRFRLGLAESEPQDDKFEKQLAQLPTIAVPSITLEGDANGAPDPADPSAYRQKFTGKYVSRIISGGIGHNLPQEAPQAFGQALIDVDGF